MTTYKTRASSVYRSEYTSCRQRVASTKMSKKVGSNFAYFSTDIIGEGMSSKVYKGMHLKTRQPVSIKIINKETVKDPRLGLLVKNEIKLLSKMAHENVLRLESVFENDEQLCIVTEFCGKGDLESQIKNNGRLSESVALSIIRDVISGYTHLITQNVIHRDIKPANIFLTEQKAIIADFGFAMTPKDFDVARLNVGSPLYMPVESLQTAAYSHKSDIFAIGAVLYEMLHGKTPWTAKTQKELISKMKKQVPFIDPSLKLSTETVNFLRESLRMPVDKRMGTKQLVQFYHRLNDVCLKQSCETKVTAETATEGSVQNTSTKQNSSIARSKEHEQERMLIKVKSVTDRPDSPMNQTQRFQPSRPPKYPPLAIRKRQLSSYCQVSNTSNIKKRQSTQEDKENGTKRSESIANSEKLTDFAIDVALRFRCHLQQEALKFLPNMLSTKTYFVLSYFINILKGTKQSLEIPDQLVGDKQISDLLTQKTPTTFCHEAQPFIRRMVRLISHYMKQNSQNIPILWSLLNFYRIVKEGRDRMFWNKKSIEECRVVNATSFKLIYNSLL